MILNRRRFFIEENMKKKVAHRPVEWTEEKVLTILDEIIDILDKSPSVVAANKSIQPKYLDLREVCIDIKIPYSRFTRRLSELIENSEDKQIFWQKRKIVESIFANVISSGGLRKELDSGLVKHVLVNTQGDLTERSESKTANYNFEVNLSQKLDSKQLSELLLNIEAELAEFNSFVEYHKTVKPRGRQKKLTSGDEE